MKGAAGVILAPLGALYSAVTRARLALYRRGALTVHRINSPVISVGNITTGGTGKTPLVEWVARTATSEGRKPCILTRGYGREDVGRRVLVSDGERVLADAREGGDEPRQLAESLRGVAAVLSDADRVSAARWAEEHLKSDLFILDDGFQHLRLARDLDILAVDATDPWGGGRLLPAGRLREPLKGLKRADRVIITRTEQAADADSLREQAARLSGGRPVILSRTRTKAVRPLSEAATRGNAPDVPARPSSSQPIAAFCAIGNPAAFFAHLRREGFVLNHTRAFPDHHVYKQRDVDALVAAAKDAVKLRSLRFDLPCYVLEMELTFDDEEKLTGMLREVMGRR